MTIRCRLCRTLATNHRRQSVTQGKPRKGRQGPKINPLPPPPICCCCWFVRCRAATRAVRPRPCVRPVTAAVTRTRSEGRAARAMRAAAGRPTETRHLHQSARQGFWRCTGCSRSGTGGKRRGVCVHVCVLGSVPGTSAASPGTNTKSRPRREIGCRAKRWMRFGSAWTTGKRRQKEARGCRVQHIQAYTVPTHTHMKNWFAAVSVCMWVGE